VGRIVAPYLSGATILPTGQVALALNPVALVRGALERTGAAFTPTPPEQARKRRLVVADDSITTRCLEKSILEGAGFEVIAAPDGAEALRALEEGGVDLLVADVDMPRLDGIGLTEAIRSSPRLRKLPVVLVTSLSSDRDRARGLEAGADAYLIKSAFDQRVLLETISRLL
jgi:two-component system, chemotaxis family, sensor kinase CheA